MAEIGASEAKNTLGTLLDRVERGEEIVITRHKKPVARLVPHARHVDHERIRAALGRIRKRAQRLNKKEATRAAFEWPTVKKLRDQGRP